MIYIPKHFENTNLSELHEFIERYNFATLINQSEGETFVSHIPMMLDRSAGEYGVLSGHLAKLNPQWKSFNDTEKVLCIFQGPHAYISPSWYKSRSVPTWNYAAVHVQGCPRLIDSAELSNDLVKMVAHHEQYVKESNPYEIPKEQLEHLINHIVGFKIDIVKMEGKFKLGQNRIREDQEGMLLGLRRQKNAEATSLANFIETLMNKQ